MAIKSVPAAMLPLTTSAVDSFRGRLLAWYDRHARLLPWRAPPGENAVPYHVWLSEIMLQQTTVAAVKSYFLKFVERWPTVESLAAASHEDVMAAWAGLGYYARARNLHACAKIVAGQHGGTFPVTEAALRALPGIGDYTSAAIASIAGGLPAVVVDGNVERVVARWFGVETPLPAAKKMIKTCAGILSEGRTDRPGDFAQAMMDLGATLCTPRGPVCGICPLFDDCAARLSGRPESLPRRLPKKSKPKKIGHVYWITDGEGRVFLEQRAGKGLLGGMLGMPTSEWLPINDEDKLGHPAWVNVKSASQREKISVFHSFTHFDLELRLHHFCMLEKPPLPGFWFSKDDILQAGLPSLFKKCVKLVL